MEPQPSQRIWIITGANSGLGLAMASYVLSKGDRVRAPEHVYTDRLTTIQVIATVRSLTKFPQHLREQGARPLVLDLSDPDKEIKRAAEDALQVYGRVDVLVNNAAWGLVDPWEETE